MHDFIKKINNIKKLFLITVVILSILIITYAGAFFIHSESIRNIFSFNLKSYLVSNSYDQFWNDNINDIKSQITTVKFNVLDEETILDEYNAATYKSRADDLDKFGNKIYAYVKENNGEIELNISSKSKIYFPSNCANMFADFTNLKYVDLSSNNNNIDTSNVEVLSRLFANCTSLVQQDISIFKNSKLTFFDRIFLNCNSLEKVVGINKLDVSNVMSIDWLFENCSKLESVDISNWVITNKIESLYGIFSGCKSLSELKLGTFDTSNVNTILRLFENCESLTSIDVNDWDVSKVTNMELAFKGMKNLTSLDLSNWITSSLVNSKGMFLDDTSLTTLKVDKFDTSKVTSMEYMFKNMSSIETLNLSNFIIDNISKTNGLNSLFIDDIKLKDLDISNFEFSDGVSHDYMFTNMPDDAKVKVKDCNVARWLDKNLIKNTDLPSAWKSTTYYSNDEAYCPLNLGYMLNFNETSISTIEANINSVKFENKTLSEINEALQYSNDNNLWNQNITNGNYVGEDVYAYATVNSLDSSLYDIHVVSIAEVISLPKESSRLFSNMKNNLTSVDFNDYVTSYQVESFSSIFNGCTKLEIIKGMENFDTSNVIYIDWMFQNCRKLKTIDLSGWNITNKVTTMWGIFDKCNELENLTLGNFDTSNVTIMTYLFAECKKLKTLNINDWDVSKVKNFDLMFSYMLSLESLDLSNWVTSSAESMFGLFISNSNLTNIRLDNFDTSNVAEMRFVFQNNSKLTNLDISNFTTEKAIDMSAMFDGMIMISNLDISGMDFNEGVNYDGIFRNLPISAKVKLKNCNISKWISENLNKESDYPNGWIGKNFYTDDELICPINNAYIKNIYSNSGISLIEAKVNSITFETNSMENINSTINYAQENGLWNENLTDTNFVSEEVFGYASVNAQDDTLYDIHIVTPANKIYLPSDSSWMFSGVKNALKSIDFGNIVNSSLVTNFSSLFNGCTNLESINGITNFDTSNVIYVDYMFQNCNKLKSLDLSNWILSDKIIQLIGVFEGCSSLENLSLGTFDTSNVTNMNYLFNGCNKLTSLEINDWDVSKVKYFNSTFRGLSSLSTLDLSNWVTSSALDMFAMFLGDSNITSLNISKFNVSLVTDMRYMFQHMYKLEDLNISNFILNENVNAESMFELMTSLQNLDISNFVFTSTGNFTGLFRNVNSTATVNVKDCSVENWFFENLTATNDYPSGWSSRVNIITPEVCNLKYNVSKMNIISSDLLSFYDKSTVSHSIVKINDSNRNLYATVKLQGTSSLTYPKKNYTITFYEDSTYTTKLKLDVNKGWGDQSKYCLKANYMDSTQARNIVSARLAAGMQEKYGLFEDTPNRGLVDGFFIEVYVNDEYLGLYTMNIPKDAWMFNMDKNNENHIVLAAENPYNETSTTFHQLAPSVDGKDWSIEVGPNKTQEEVDQVFAKLNRLISFVKDSSVEEFRNNISNYMNLDALMNYYCFIALSNAVDNMNKNMLLVTYDGNIWYPSLYDLDTTWGLYYNGEGVYSSTNKVTDYGGGSSLLFKKLLEAFPEEVQTRYFELRNTVLTNDNIINQFSAFINIATSEQWDREHTKWPNIPSKDYDINQIITHVKERGNYVDSIMKQLYIEQKTYTDNRIIYKLDEPYVGDINKFIDTGINLYSKPSENRKYTILTRFKSNATATSSQNIFTARNSNYHGMVIKNAGDGTDSYHTFNMGNNEYEALYKTYSNEYTTLVFTLDVDTYNMYSGSISQKRTIVSDALDTDIYNVVIGADYYKNSTSEYLASFFTGEIKDFIIYNEVLLDEEISSLFETYN